VRVNRQMPTQKQPVGRINQTDLGNARRLVSLFGSKIRYCFDWGQWLIWNDIRWQSDRTGEIERLAKKAALRIYDELSKIKSDDARKKLESWANKSESKRAIKDMIDLARSEPGIPITSDELDANPFQLNCLNGTVDLRTGELHPHRREDLITKLAPVEYDQEAYDHTWEKVLRESTDGNIELQELMQRAFGYSTTGDTSEEVLFLIHGPAATSESTIIEAIKATLGDYAMTADFESFIKRRDVGGPRNDIARLAGSRLVVSIEVDEGKQLAEGLVKMITGSDTITARKLYQESFEFKPTFKLVLVANHAPKVDPDDDAMWRRICVIPMDCQVPKELRDPKVKAHLTDPTKAGPAILQWLLKGCLDWQRERLKIPAVVQQATDEYRSSQDSFGDFISDCCILEPDAWVSSEALRAAHKTWSREHEGWPNGHSHTDQAFAKKLRRFGAVAKKGTGGVRRWRGIGLDRHNSDFEISTADEETDSVQ
jgi:putative DNA primase/helicase